MMVVPGRPSARGLSFWVLMDQPGRPSVNLTGAGIAQARISIVSLARPDDPAIARQLYLVACLGLTPDQRYRLVVSRDGVFAEAWSRTLPLSVALGDCFSIALGSCYCVARSKGIDACYPPKLHEGDTDPIRFRVLAGDQIYMDASERTGQPILSPAPKPYERYLSQWTKLLYSSWLQRSPNLVMADDHEFWNDYPHRSFWLTWSESAPGGPLGRSMDRAYALFQVALNLEAASAAAASDLPNQLDASARSFQLDVSPLSFFFLDTRTERTRFDAHPARLCSAASLQRALAWTRALKAPGVLVIPQPLVAERASNLARALHAQLDVNLPDYPADFRALWEAVSSAPHDIVILTGDLHYSRLYSISRAPISQTRVYEVVSSPLARIPSGTKANSALTGKVEFAGGSARWTKFYAGNPEATYTTLTFQPMSGRLQLAVRSWLVGRNATAQLGWERSLSLT